MIRTWQFLALSALLAGTSAAPAQEPDRNNNNDLKLILRRLDAVEQMRTNMTTLAERVKTLEEKKLPPDRTADVLKEIRNLETKIVGQVDALGTNLQGMMSDVQGVKKSVQSLSADVEGIKTVQIDVQAVKKELQTLGTDLQATKKEHALVRGDMSTLMQEQTQTNLRAQVAKSKADQLDSQVKALQEDVQTLQKRLLAAATPAPSPAPTVPALFDRGTLDDIRLKLGSIEQAVLKIQIPNGMPYATNRIANASPITTTAAGRVVLVNHYTEDMLFSLNGQHHRVPPGRTEVVEGVPAGVLSYRAVSPTWGVTKEGTTALASNDTFTLTAR